MALKQSYDSHGALIWGPAGAAKIPLLTIGVHINMIVIGP